MHYILGKQGLSACLKTETFFLITRKLTNLLIGFVLFAGMSFFMEQNKFPNPVYINLLGSNTKMFDPDQVLDLI